MKQRNEMLYREILYIANLCLEQMTEEEIQKFFCSDYFHELKSFIKKEQKKIEFKWRGRF